MPYDDTMVVGYLRQSHETTQFTEREKHLVGLAMHEEPRGIDKAGGHFENTMRPPRPGRWTVAGAAQGPLEMIPPCRSMSITATPANTPSRP